MLPGIRATGTPGENDSAAASHGTEALKVPPGFSVPDDASLYSATPPMLLPDEKGIAAETAKPVPAVKVAPEAPLPIPATTRLLAPAANDPAPGEEEDPVAVVDACTAIVPGGGAYSSIIMAIYETGPTETC